MVRALGYSEEEAETQKPERRYVPSAVAFRLWKSGAMDAYEVSFRCCIVRGQR